MNFQNWMLLLLLFSFVSTAEGHFLDDYFEIGQYLPEIWMEMPYIGLFDISKSIPEIAGRGSKPTERSSEGTVPTAVESSDGITCQWPNNSNKFRHFFQNFDIGNFDSISLTMFVKTDYIGPIWSSLVVPEGEDPWTSCYIAVGYEDERLNSILGKNRVHARCGLVLKRLLAIENCPVDVGAQIALVYDYQKNTMRLYCNDRFDETPTTVGLKPHLATKAWIMCGMHNTPEGYFKFHFETFSLIVLF